MMTCVTVPAMNRRIASDDPRLNAHKMPMAMATETIMDCASAAGEMQQAIAHGHSQEEVERLREVARALFESYLDLMAEAGHHAGQLRP